MAAGPIIKGLTKVLAKNVKGGLSSLNEPLTFPAKPSKWWLDPDKDVATLYHGTNIKNLQQISEEGLRADRQGFTYLTPDPDTGIGYAVMDQGEKVFRGQAKPRQVPIEERALLEIEVPQKEIISDIQRSPTSKEKLFSGRELFDESERITFRGQEGIPIDARYRSPYYDLTEVRLQQDVPAEWIKGYSIKGQKPKQKKPDVENLGKELSDAQMIGPERTMSHVLNAMHESDAGYAAGYLVEHIGDLTRKMGDGVGILGPVKLRDIKEKVGKGLRKLRYGNVEGEFNESMKGKNVKKLNKLFEKYADEHSKLPIFNKPQWLAREAAVSVGKKDFNRTRELLEELEILIDNPNNFYKLNSSIDPAFSSKLKGSEGLSGLSGLGEK
tara:strand:- start:85 stop:1236 length:1152 start_codon:yes stop_codon:yes gene_type:complete